MIENGASLPASHKSIAELNREFRILNDELHAIRNRAMEIRLLLANGEKHDHCSDIPREARDPAGTDLADL